MFDGNRRNADDLTSVAGLRPDILDLRFTDVAGRWGHVCHWVGGATNFEAVPALSISSSSLTGWGDAARSELFLEPITETAFIDPFAEQRTAIVQCRLREGTAREISAKDSRSTLERACARLRRTGIADSCAFGTELEFYLFDEVRFRHSSNDSFYSIEESDSLESRRSVPRGGASGHRISYPAHRLSAGPSDWASGFRSSLLKQLAEVGVAPRQHQHEDGPSQHEISLCHADAVQMADRIQVAKYVVTKGAAACGQTATFMPKPLAYKAGSGLHINVSLWRDEAPVFAGDRAHALSETGRFFLAGILAHARALTALLCPSVNGFKRLDAISNPMVPVAWGVGNRTVPIRIPPATSPEEARIEVRFADATANPYLAFAAVLLAGLDGVERGLDPGMPCEGDIMRLKAPFDPRRVSPDSLCRTLDEAIVALDRDSDFLRTDDIFSASIIDAHIAELCRQVRVCRALPHPNEFLMSFGA